MPHPLTGGGRVWGHLRHMLIVTVIIAGNYKVAIVLECLLVPQSDCFMHVMLLHHHLGCQVTYACAVISVAVLTLSFKLCKESQLLDYIFIPIHILCGKTQPIQCYSWIRGKPHSVPRPFLLQ